MDARRLKRLMLHATGLVIAVALAIVLSGRYGPMPLAFVALAALAWAAGRAAACSRIGGADRKADDRTAVIWTA